MGWWQQHANFISALASTGMLVIWTFYAWLFYQEFRRQRGAQLFIHEAGGGEPESVCMLVNLSKEPVHILCSLATCDGATARLHDTQDHDRMSPTQRAKQGPLQAGESLTLGSFETIRRQLGIMPDNSSGGDATIIEVHVAAIHGFRQWPVGARRRFQLTNRAKKVVPATKTTEQLNSRRQAREVQSWLESCEDK